LLATVAVWYW